MWGGNEFWFRQNKRSSDFFPSHHTRHPTPHTLPSPPPPLHTSNRLSPKTDQPKVHRFGSHLCLSYRPWSVQTKDAYYSVPVFLQGDPRQKQPEEMKYSKTEPLTTKLREETPFTQSHRQIFKTRYLSTPPLNKTNLRYRYGKVEFESHLQFLLIRE